MQFRPRAGYPLMAVGFVAFYLLLLPFTFHPTHSTLRPRLKCNPVPFVGGPTPMYACSDGHAWQRQGKKRVDAGPMLPGSGMIPRR